MATKKPIVWLDNFKATVKKDKLNRVQQFKLLTIRKKRLEAMQEEVEVLLKTAEEAIMAEWEQSGVATMKLDTGETVYTHSQYWAKRLPVYETDKKGNPILDKDEQPIVKKDAEGEELYHTAEEVIDALKACGLSDLVKEGYNANSLSSVVREWKKNKEEMPTELAKVLVAEPTYSIRIRGLKVIEETILSEEEVY